MNHLHYMIRETGDHKAAGAIRLFVGFLIMSTGWMKYLVPMLREAWSSQLLQAGLPFYDLVFWVVPGLEITVGLLLMWGGYSRLGMGVVMIIMLVATYVHLTVHDPAAFPLQPNAPLAPLLLLALGAYILRKGGGTWSKDLAWTQQAKPDRQ